MDKKEATKIIMDGLFERPEDDYTRREKRRVWRMGAVAILVILVMGGLAMWHVWIPQGDYLIIRKDKNCWRVPTYTQGSTSVSFTDKRGNPIRVYNPTTIKLKKPADYEYYRKKMNLPPCL
jgi:hypothetical protein